MTTYREAVAADLAAICAIGKIVNDRHHEIAPKFFAPPSDALRDEAVWKQSIESASATTFVAEEAGQVIGFVNVGIVDETNSLAQPIRFVRVGMVGVLESYRRRGIGRSLMEHAEHWAAARGAVDIRLTVWTFNEDAIRLYRDLGYEVRSQTMGKSAGTSAVRRR